MGIFGGKKGTYLVVWHHYWMQHKCWDHEILVDVTEKEAKAYGAQKAQELKSTFNHVDSTAIKLPDEIHVVHKKDTP